MNILIDVCKPVCPSRNGSHLPVCGHQKFIVKHFLFIIVMIIIIYLFIARVLYYSYISVILVFETIFFLLSNAFGKFDSHVRMSVCLCVVLLCASTSLINILHAFYLELNIVSLSSCAFDPNMNHMIFIRFFFLLYYCYYLFIQINLYALFRWRLFLHNLSQFCHGRLMCIIYIFESGVITINKYLFLCNTRQREKKK